MIGKGEFLAEQFYPRIELRNVHQDVRLQADALIGLEIPAHGDFIGDCAIEKFPGHVRDARLRGAPRKSERHESCGVRFAAVCGSAADAGTPGRGFFASGNASAMAGKPAAASMVALKRASLRVMGMRSSLLSGASPAAGL